MEFELNRKDFKPFGCISKNFHKNGLWVDFVKTQEFICKMVCAVVVGLRVNFFKKLGVCL
jgi:hypothetical protein